MATQKNQHYVPKVYLRPFTNQAAGLAINLLNIDRFMAVRNAPVKKQCSSDYFYGRDLVVEKALGLFEGDYGLLLSRLQAPKYVLSDADKDELKEFWLLQFLRTDAASRRFAQLTADFESGVQLSGTEIKVSIADAVQMAMGGFRDQRHVVSDLKVCLLRNRTRVPFFTSDDPAVLANRWHQQDRRAIGTSFGVGNAGTLLLLPLTPGILMIAYDGAVHSITQKDGWVDVRDAYEIRALNEHQFMNCLANIYFGEWGDCDLLKSTFDAAKNLRPAVRHRITYAKFDREVDGKQFFRPIPTNEVNRESKLIAHFQSDIGRPSTWPKLLRWRTNGSVFSDGSGLGFMREFTSSAFVGEGFKRLRAGW